MYAALFYYFTTFILYSTVLFISPKLCIGYFLLLTSYALPLAQPSYSGRHPFLVFRYLSALFAVAFNDVAQIYLLTSLSVHAFACFFVSSLTHLLGAKHFVVY